MTLNPTLKSILVRTAYIVGSLTIYYIAYNYCLDYLDFHYWSDGGDRKSTRLNSSHT